MTYDVIAITGTPGTGKTSVATALPETVVVRHLNDVIESADLAIDEDLARNSTVVDLDALEEWAETELARIKTRPVVFESHLSHHLPVSLVICLRCRPDALEHRLEDRGKPAASINENVESEALDLLLAEAVDRHGQESVHQIDTSDRSVEDVASEVMDVIEGSIEPSIGTIDFSAYLEGEWP